MRQLLYLVAGVLIGAGAHAAAVGPRDIVSLNHVALAAANFDEAAKFYTDVMGFPEAFAFREPDGRPRLSYFQVNRNTFVELMPVSSDRPAGFVHFGLEVSNLDAVVKRLRARGMNVKDPALSPRTKSRVAVARTPQGVVVELLEFGPDSLHRKVMTDWKD
jgi:catechol 2,3-dioxygenase-like lactoylglutathione lyase family enzyme